MSAAIAAPTLSVVIPVYNEVGTIGPVIAQVAGALPGVRKEIIVVDDCSHDGSASWLRRNLAEAGGVWRNLEIDGDGELRLFARGAQNAAGFSVTVLFH